MMFKKKANRRVNNISRRVTVEAITDKSKSKLELTRTMFSDQLPLNCWTISTKTYHCYQNEQDVLYSD